MTQLQIQNLQILVTSGISEAVEFQFFAIQWTCEKDYEPPRRLKMAKRANLIQTIFGAHDVILLSSDKSIPININPMKINPY